MLAAAHALQSLGPYQTVLASDVPRASVSPDPQAGADDCGPGGGGADRDGAHCGDDHLRPATQAGV